MSAAPRPIWGLVAVKVAAMALGLYCWRGERLDLLRKVNWLYAALITWNLVALIVSYSLKI